ncbi:putative effector protein [Ceratobasidium theobromae]|uniref:Putative effector protein n=1 Tax=Ceratobasidium theobromae TaxID=1582974 RepID=A0A5N5QVV8_9AGAM|nr:putative effector protein [Ceratobasidium theobromae]
MPCLSFFTALLVAFMALIVIAAPNPAFKPKPSTTQAVAHRIRAHKRSCHAPTCTPAPTKPASSNGDGKVGTATWFNTGLGSCGKVSNDNELVVALGPGSFNSGKMCGATITVKNNENGKTTTAKVVDLCPSCGTNNLDLSPAAFKKLGSLSTGVLNVSWDDVCHRRIGLLSGTRPETSTPVAIPTPLY